jgi:hypothetical protein
VEFAEGRHRVLEKVVISWRGSIRSGEVTIAGGQPCRWRTVNVSEIAGGC